MVGRIIRRPDAAGWLTAAALGVTIALRSAYVWSIRPTPWFTFLNVDPGFYDQWARAIAAGHWLGERPFYMDPLYPYVLGVLYATVGHGLLAPRLLNIALAAGTCWLIARQSRRLAGPWGMAIGAAGYALYAPDVFHTGEIDKTALSTFLVAASLDRLARRGVRATVAGGVLLGLGTLTRANLLAAVPVVAFWRWFDVDATSPRTGAVREMSALVAGMGLALLPGTLHNYWVSGQFVLTTSQAGQNFYIGNCPENPQGGYGVLPFVRGAPPYEEIDFRSEAERRTGRTLTPSEVSGFWFGESWRYLRAQPGTALAVLGRKWALFWNDFEIPDSTDQYLAERYSGVMALPLVSFGMVLPWAAIGASLAWRDRTGRLLLGFTAMYALTTVTFFVMARYRIQVVAALLPLAARGVVAMRDWVRGARWPAVAQASLGALCVGAFGFQQVDVFGRRSEVQLQQQWHHLGMIYAQAGDTARALDAHLEAARTCDRFCRMALEDLLQLYINTNRFDEGVATFEQFLARRPGHPVATEVLTKLATVRAARGGGAVE